MKTHAAEPSPMRGAWPALCALCALILTSCMTTYTPDRTSRAPVGAQHPGRSDIVHAFMYDEGAEALTLYYLSGARVEYREVPVSVYEGLLKAPLKGGYVKGIIQGRFPTATTRAAPPPPQAEPMAEAAP